MFSHVLQQVFDVVRMNRPAELERMQCVSLVRQGVESIIIN